MISPARTPLTRSSVRCRPARRPPHGDRLARGGLRDDRRRGLAAGSSGVQLGAALITDRRVLPPDISRLDPESSRFFNLRANQLLHSRACRRPPSWTTRSAWPGARQAARVRVRQRILRTISRRRARPAPARPATPGRSAAARLLQRHFRIRAAGSALVDRLGSRPPSGGSSSTTAGRSRPREPPADVAAEDHTGSLRVLVHRPFAPDSLVVGKASAGPGLDEGWFVAGRGVAAVTLLAGEHPPPACSIPAASSIPLAADV